MLLLMWPFRRAKAPAPRRLLREVVAGLIIGGAIGSIIGSKVLEKMEREEKRGRGNEEEEQE